MCETKTKIIADKNCDAQMLRSKLRAIRTRVMDTRLMLELCIGDAVQASQPELAKRLR